jgi:thiol-disulfide isomerase/thioredoxin
MNPLLNNTLKKMNANRTNIAIGMMAALILIFGSYAVTGYFTSDSPDDTESADIATFTYSGSDICLVDGKPVVRMFSTTRCPHCEWIKDTFDSVAKEYAEEGKIVAYHWELDINDDTLTPEYEGAIPDSEWSEFRRISGSGVPAYSMGCRYIRIGNGHEREDDLAAEEADFREVIEKLIADAGG